MATQRTVQVASGRRGGMYHGTKVLVALFLAGFMVYGGGLYCFALFIPPLTAEFHWSRAETSGLFTVFWLSAPLILLGGAAIRRFGAARLLMGGIVIEALCVAALATVSEYWQMYLLRAAMGFGKVLFAVTLPYAVSTWYRRNYSFGLGVVWAGWHVGGLVLAPIAGWIIAHSGWRATCLAIAGGLMTVALIPVLLTRSVRAPAELGLAVDGIPLPVSGDGNATTVEATPLHDAPAGSLSALLRAPLFALIALTTLFFYATYGGLLSQEASVVEGAGFSPWLSSLVLGATAGFAALGGLSVGWILDRYSIRAVGFAMHVLLLAGAVSLLLVEKMHSPLALVTYAACFGITIGGSDLFFVALLRERFPKVSVAYSYSAWYFCEILTLFVAGPLAGRIFDLTGDYDRTLALLAASATVALLLATFAMPRHRAMPQQS